MPLTIETHSNPEASCLFIPYKQLFSYFFLLFFFVIFSMHNNSNSTFALIKNLVPRQHLQQWKPAEPTTSNKKPLIKWFYFFRSTPEHLPVRVSNIAYKDYDPGTGNKILNNYMILREIGRGMHGKVKLAQDLDTGELVVYIQNHT